MITKVSSRFSLTFKGEATTSKKDENYSFVEVKVINSNTGDKVYFDSFTFSNNEKFQSRMFLAGRNLDLTKICKVLDISDDDDTYYFRIYNAVLALFASPDTSIISYK